jgi:hypothetical protein
MSLHAEDQELEIVLDDGELEHSHREHRLGEILAALVVALLVACANHHAQPVRVSKLDSPSNTQAGYYIHMNNAIWKNTYRSIFYFVWLRTDYVMPT